MIYTTHAIEPKRQLRKAIKTKGHFPTEDAARKLIYLAVTNADGGGPDTLDRRGRAPRGV